MKRNPEIILGLSRLSIRMAIVAGLAVIGIAGNVLMSVISILLIVLMAENAFESHIIIWNNVTFGANVPTSLMPPGKNGEI